MHLQCEERGPTPEQVNERTVPIIPNVKLGVVS